MLSRLPSELIYFIASFLPTAGCLARLAQTCRHLYNIVAADNYRIFQAFVQGQYPAITAPPLWRDAAHALALRSHAFQRHAVSGRFVLTPPNATRIGNPRTIRTDRPTLGYRPVIDSYESWYANDWFARKEVLAWGAGADVVLRIKDLGRHDNDDELKVNGTGSRNRSYDGAKWIVFNDLHDVNSWDDVAGLHLLGASSSADCPDREDLIIGRRNGDVVHLSISPSEGSSMVKARFDTNGHKLDHTDLSTGTDRVLAVALDGRSIACYKLDSEDESVQPFASLKTISHGPSRNRCSKLLSNQQIAVGADGEAAKIDVFNFDPKGVRKERTIRIEDDEDESASRKPRVTTIVPLPALHSASGRKSSSLFLSGWEDSKTRLHDLRSPRPCVAAYGDTVDDSPTYTLLPIGHERLMVGSGANALVKIFDLRMTGKHHIEAHNASPSLPKQSHWPNDSDPCQHYPLDSVPYPRKDISIFLCNEPLGSRNNTRAQPNLQTRRYRGPIYSMSLPSPTSSTLYVGIINNVVRLDMTATDDLFTTGNEDIQENWCLANLSSKFDPNAAAEYQPFELSCYERPLPEDRGRGVRLMMQKPFWEASTKSAAGIGTDTVNGQQDNGIPGWDERWFQPWISRTRRIKGPWRRSYNR
ncbi:hypothetical protein FQN49_004158 [Arthroderma sp. PD_2]|nr:hypothetical protein FQN49_004158 [Arthroderma sp. PD_2]